MLYPVLCRCSAYRCVYRTLDTQSLLDNARPWEESAEIYGRVESIKSLVSLCIWNVAAVYQKAKGRCFLALWREVWANQDLQHAVCTSQRSCLRVYLLGRLLFVVTLGSVYLSDLHLSDRTAYLRAEHWAVVAKPGIFVWCCFCRKHAACLRAEHCNWESVL